VALVWQPLSKGGAISAYAAAITLTDSTFFDNSAEVRAAEVVMRMRVIVH
jgi:hypothetical protein